MEKLRREAKDKILRELIYLQTNLDLEIRLLRILKFDADYIKAKESVETDLAKSEEGLKLVNKKIEILENIYGKAEANGKTKEVSS